MRKREWFFIVIMTFILLALAVTVIAAKAYSDGYKAGCADTEQSMMQQYNAAYQLQETQLGAMVDEANARAKEAEQALQETVKPAKVDKLPEPVQPEPEEKTEFRAEDYIMQSDPMTDPKEYAGVIMRRLPAMEWYSEDDLFCYAALIYQEAGGDRCSDDTRAKVAEVAGNRVEDPRFPNTIREVLEQSIDGALQYGRYAITGVQFSERAYMPEEWHAVQRAYRIALDYLMGANTGGLRGAGYIWQSENPQGTDQIWQDGVCFGKG